MINYYTRRDNFDLNYDLCNIPQQLSALTRSTKLKKKIIRQQEAARRNRPHGDELNTE